MPKLILEGKDCGFTWSASHLLPGHYKCSRMHGHNYVMNIEISSEDLVNGMIVDFVEIKKEVRRMIEIYDHRLMLPEEALIHNKTSMEVEGINNFYEIKYQGMNDTEKVYTIPHEDVVFLPLNVITAENLAKYFAIEIRKIVKGLMKANDSTFTSIEVTIFEDSGQGASYQISN